MKDGCWWGNPNLDVGLESGTPPFNFDTYIICVFLSKDSEPGRNNFAPLSSSSFGRRQPLFL